MKELFLTLLLCVSLFLTSCLYAQCDDLPTAPNRLHDDAFTLQEFELLSEQVEIYFQSIDQYQQCLLDSSVAYDPEGAEAATFIQTAEELTRLYEMAEAQKLITVDRYNNLITLSGKAAVTPVGQ